MMTKQDEERNRPEHVDIGDGDVADGRGAVEPQQGETEAARKSERDAHRAQKHRRGQARQKQREGLDEDPPVEKRVEDIHADRTSLSHA